MQAEAPPRKEAPCNATRLERDALGELALPADALYGIHTARALRNLSFSLRSLGSCAPYARALGVVKGAAARANADAGVLAPELAHAIDLASRRISSGALADALVADLLGGGGSIAVHMNVAEVIANVASESLGGHRGEYVPVHPKRHVNASQSTADVCHTALRLAILERSVVLRAALEALAATIDAKISELGDVPTLARTCLQDALPTTLALLFVGHAALIRRRAKELAHSLEALHAVALGGTVIGSGEGAPARYRERVVPLLAARAGLELRCHPAPCDALQNGDDVGAVSAQLALLAHGLAKIAQDLRLLGSGPRGGMGELRLPHVQEGSSFFADKSNPLVPETLLQACFQVLGCDRAVQAALEHGELHLNVFDGLAAVNVLDALELLSNAIVRFDEGCVRGLIANEARCRELASFGRTS
ncbi:MAG TPA: lyase family protein [Myxococcota bacterium]|nr:lyase family protein [Myxococcota bacterium]